MENALDARDRVGVQDFVLLEDYLSERAFLDNLKKRFNENLIYTYIGPVLVSVNPYRNLDIYGPEFTKKYQNVNFYELPPHVFAVTDMAYRSMREEVTDQCVLISGESGSGKTEASKKVLEFLAAASHNSTTVENVKDKLLHSNPVLEAFGNAKTTRNDNSSRFGKYMDIEFNFMGAPIGGHILNYLLEKSRVVFQSNGERNFHAFYQLLAGAPQEVLDRLRLRRDPGHYYYLSQGESNAVDGMDDAAAFRRVASALRTVGFEEEDESALYDILAAVLHLGNVGFTEKEGSAVVAQTKPVQELCKLLGCSEVDLLAALTHRTIDTKREKVVTSLTRDQAIFARDALAKSVYGRTFDWIVTTINQSLLSKEKKGRRTLMGILDIYGFEILSRNSFEQFCINYCNEKLQQLFIELTLKSEQEEYHREGIEWEPVEYFNNKIICDLVEERHKGIIAILDEECVRPGDATDATFLQKMELVLGNHRHFISHKATSDAKTRKTLQRDEFRLVHYAGDVTYKVEGFLDKNNDLLFRDLKEVMCKTSNKVTRHMFLLSELDSMKRPDTAATQFKTSLSHLMVILMSKEPSYIRCIKPNDEQRPHHFQDPMVLHQIKYLGLMENLRVRRAGFAYRRPYEVFLKRYKSLCPSTWPNYRGRGGAKEGVKLLVEHLAYKPDEYRMGKTKLFIRFPKTLFRTEDAFQRRKQELASKIQAMYKGVLQRRKYLRMREAAIVIAKYYKGLMARRLLERRKVAAYMIRRFVKGFITRNDAPNEFNAKFIKQSRKLFLLRLRDHLPKTVLEKTWTHPPKCCEEASRLLHALHTRWLVRCYIRKLTPERKRQLEQKVLAEELFKGKKQSYERTIPMPFQENRLSPEVDSLRQANFEKTSKPQGEKTLYCCPVTKYDRHGYKCRERLLVVTDGALYVVDAKDGAKVKDRVPLDGGIQGLHVSHLSDGLLVVRTMDGGTTPTAINNNGPAPLTPNATTPTAHQAKNVKNKGDLILNLGHAHRLIEAIVKVIMATGNQKKLLYIDTSGTISHSMSSGKQGLIELSVGSEHVIAKGKNGHLVVVAAAAI